MRNSNRLSALFFLALSLFICQQAIVIGVGSLYEPGPGLLDFSAGAGIGIISLCLFIQSIISKKNQGDVAPHRSNLNTLRFIMICASLFVYIIITDWLGFVLSTFLFISFTLRLIESEKWWRTLIKASLITMGNYLIFVVWLGLSLPKGFVDW